MLSCPGKAPIVAEAKDAKPDSAKVKVRFELPADVPVGMHTMRVATKQGVSNFRPLIVDDLPSVDEVATNRTKDTAQGSPQCRARSVPEPTPRLPTSSKSKWRLGES